MLISDLETKDMIVELVDEEAGNICGGKSTLKVGRFTASVENVDFQSEDFNIKFDKGFIDLQGITVTF